MKVVVVNDQDEVLGYKDRSDRNPLDIIRVAGLWIFNSKGEVLISQRALDKKNDPGKWSPSVGGTVEEGETYLSNILKEIHEELGIVCTEEDLIVGPHRIVEGSHKYFCQVYFVKIDLPVESFTLQADEVVQVKWVSIDALLHWMDVSPDDFQVSFHDTLQDYLDFVA